MVSNDPFEKPPCKIILSISLRTTVGVSGRNQFPSIPCFWLRREQQELLAGTHVSSPFVKLNSMRVFWELSPT